MIEVYSRMVSRANCVVELIIHGHHVCKAIWEPVDGKELTCECEIRNPQNLLSVAMKTHHKEDNIVGHIPCKISLLLEVQILDGFIV